MSSSPALSVSKAASDTSATAAVAKCANIYTDDMREFASLAASLVLKEALESYEKHLGVPPGEDTIQAFRNAICYVGVEDYVAKEAEDMAKDAIKLQEIPRGAWAPGQHASLTETNLAKLNASPQSSQPSDIYEESFDAPKGSSATAQPVFEDKATLVPIREDTASVKALFISSSDGSSVKSLFEEPNAVRSLSSATISDADRAPSTEWPCPEYGDDPQPQQHDLTESGSDVSSEWPTNLDYGDEHPAKSHVFEADLSGNLSNLVSPSYTPPSPVFQLSHSPSFQPLSPVFELSNSPTYQPLSPVFELSNSPSYQPMSPDPDPDLVSILSQSSTSSVSCRTPKSKSSGRSQSRPDPRVARILANTVGVYSAAGPQQETVPVYRSDEDTEREDTAFTPQKRVRY